MDPVERILKDYRNAGEEHRLDTIPGFVCSTCKADA